MSNSKKRLYETLTVLIATLALSSYAAQSQMVRLPFWYLVQSDPNLVAFWRMNETTGTIFNDLSPNKMNGTIVSGITLGSTSSPIYDDPSTVSTLNGTTSVASVGDQTPLNQFTRTQPFTLLYWVNPNVTKSGGSKSYQVYTKAKQTSPNNGMVFGLRWLGAATGVTWSGTAGGFLQFGSNLNAQCISLMTNQDMLNSTPYLVGWTYTGLTATAADVQAYIDGVPVSSFDQAFGTGCPQSIAVGQDTTAPGISAELGRWGSTLQQWYKGDAGEVAILNTAKSAAWMQQIALKLSPPVITWPLSYSQGSIYTPKTPRTQLLYDADMDSDIGDAAEFGMLLNLEHNRSLDIVGMLITSGNTKAAPAGLAIANYYGRANIPTGVQGSICPGNSGSSWATALASGPWAVSGKTDSSQFPSSLTVARTTLAAAAANSIDWNVNGTLGSVQSVLQSPADSISPLTGVQLIAAKVHALWINGGNWPSGNGVSDFSSPSLPANSVCAEYVLTNWPKNIPIMLFSISEGGSIQYGKNVVEALNAANPILVGWNIFFGNSSPNNIDGGWSSPSFLTMRDGLGPWISVVGANGTAAVNTSTFVTTWNQSAPANHNYLLKTATDAAIVSASNALIVDCTAWTGGCPVSP